MLNPTRIALVTGGGSGIGRAVARALCADGWTVVVAGRRFDALIETANAASDGSIIPIVADVTDEASVDALFAAIEARQGRLDLLFNNAGVTAPKLPLDELRVADLRNVIDVNLFGAMLCARGAMRLMKKQSPQGGRIINNGSVSAYAPRSNGSPYAATKHAITGLTKSITLDGRDYSITCGQIDIGNAAVARTATQAEPQIDVDYVGKAIVYMASLPNEANIPFMTLMASSMPLFGRG